MLHVRQHPQHKFGEVNRLLNIKRKMYQSVLAGVVDHPALFHHIAALPLCVFDRLDDSHQRNVVAGGGALRGTKKTQPQKHLSTIYFSLCVIVL